MTSFQNMGSSMEDIIKEGLQVKVLGCYLNTQWALN